MWKALCLFGLLQLAQCALAAERWRVTSLDWPPFSGPHLPEGGAGIVVLRAALQAEGIELDVEFYPWSRAILTARKVGYAGFYPAWPEDVGPGFSPSAVLFRSPVGFVEPKAKALVWNRLEDLKGNTIGTVQDYGNTPEFMALIRSGAVKTEIAMDDLTNVRKVAAGRIDAAFIDLNNLAYFLKHTAPNLAKKVQANPLQIGSKDLLLAINIYSAHKNANEVLRRGLSKINPEKLINDYMALHLRH